MPFREVLGPSELSHAVLPSAFRRPMMVVVAALAIASAALAARRLRPRRARRFATLFMLTSSVPFLFSVNERSAYVTGAVAAIWLAILELPRRLGLVAPGLVLAGLAFACAARVQAYGEASRVAVAVRAAAVDEARRREVPAVLLLGGPDEAFGARANATSECFALIDPEAVRVLAAYRGVSSDGRGPEVSVSEARSHLRPGPGFVFPREYCAVAPPLPADFEATVTCELGQPRLITIHRGPDAMPVALWRGAGGVQWVP